MLKARRKTHEPTSCLWLPLAARGLLLAPVLLLGCPWAGVPSLWLQRSLLRRRRRNPPLLGLLLAAPGLVIFTYVLQHVIKTIGFSNILENVFRSFSLDLHFSQQVK